MKVRAIYKPFNKEYSIEIQLDFVDERVVVEIEGDTGFLKPIYIQYDDIDQVFADWNIVKE